VTVKVAVVGGGIVGLFTAWHLEKEGVEVTIFDPGGPGAGSVHAAGIIEPETAYRTNTFAFLRMVWRLWKNGTCTFRRVDPRWLVESARQLERPPLRGMDQSLRRLADSSVATYASLAAQQNDFGYSQLGLVEHYDDPTHFAEERDLALSRSEAVPVEILKRGSAGSLLFPKVSWLHTEQFVERMKRELPKTRVLRQGVDRVNLDGTLTSNGEEHRYDAVAVSTGVGCRRLGVPITGVRGYGWHARTRDRVERATIYVDRGVAVAPFEDEVKVTGGWDFDLSTRPYHAQQVLGAARSVIRLDALLDFKEGSRPCTPDGLPTVGRRDRMVVATGGFRLGWSFAPALGEEAAHLCLDRARNDPFLSRYCHSLRSGRP
jgi:D-proline dehydrogenase